MDPKELKELLRELTDEELKAAVDTIKAQVTEMLRLEKEFLDIQARLPQSKDLGDN